MKNPIAILLVGSVFVAAASGPRAESLEEAKAKQEGALAQAEQSPALAQARQDVQKALVASAKKSRTRKKRRAPVSIIDRQVMADAGAEKLARMLNGHKLMCGPVDEAAAKTEAKGFFPVTISAVSMGSGRTRLAIATADPQQSFGYGGDDFDDVEVTDNWVILGVGDDGRRHLFLELSEEEQVGAPENYEDTYKCGTDKNGDIDGEIPGVITEIWDAGTISSRGVQCCLK